MGIFESKHSMNIDINHFHATSSILFFEIIIEHGDEM